MSGRAFPHSKMIGKTFGRLTVLSFSHYDKCRKYNCMCICGKEKIVNGVNLRSGTTKSCGCLIKIARNANMKRKEQEIIGKLFTRLTPIESVKDTTGAAAFICRCICGNQKTVARANLLSRSTKSCGCLKKRIAISEGF